CTSFSYVLLRLNRRLQTESTAPNQSYQPREYSVEGRLERCCSPCLLAGAVAGTGYGQGT
ncbi:MAG: hypothetical protein MZV63_22235, partial [Marinilabiliales bacterium]|nr:hypothetical protein [Marinilabiliales bacterium]